VVVPGAPVPPEVATPPVTNTFAASPRPVPRTRSVPPPGTRLSEAKTSDVPALPGLIVIVPDPLRLSAPNAWFVAAVPFPAAENVPPLRLTGTGVG